MAKWITPAEPLDAPVAPAPAEPAAASLAIEGVDTAAGLATMGGNEALYARLLGRFGDEQRDFAARARHCLDGGRLEEATRLAHTLRGVAGNLGAHRIAEVAKALEQACGNAEDPARLAALLAGVEEALAPTLAGVAAWRGAAETPAAEQAAVEPVDLAPILERLQVLLEQYDAEAVDVIEELERAGPAAIRGEDLRRLRQRVDDFEFDDALSVLATIREDGDHA